MKRQRRSAGSRRARRKSPNRRQQRRLDRGLKSGKWYRIKDNLGIGKWAIYFIEREVNKIDTSGLRRFNINRSSWFTRKRLGQCTSWMRPGKTTSNVRVDTPKVGKGGYHIPHQGKGKSGMTAKDERELTVFVACHELRHVAQHSGQVNVKKDTYHMEDDADTFGFDKLKQFRGEKK